MSTLMSHNVLAAERMKEMNAERNARNLPEIGQNPRMYYGRTVNGVWQTDHEAVARYDATNEGRGRARRAHYDRFPIRP